MKQLKKLEVPIGIIITMGMEVIAANGGVVKFIRHLEGCLSSETNHWLHRSKGCPTHDIAIVYICILNKIRYKVFYGGYERGPTSVWMLNGEERKIDWPRMVLGGPFEKAPHDIPMRGQQGFRYVYEPLF